MLTSACVIEKQLSDIRDDMQNLVEAVIGLSSCAISRLLARVVLFFRLMQSKLLLYNNIFAAVDAATSHISCF